MFALLVARYPNELKLKLQLILNPFPTQVLFSSAKVHESNRTPELQVYDQSPRLIFLLQPKL
jgi:hypothetical protein